MTEEATVSLSSLRQKLNRLKGSSDEKTVALTDVTNTPGSAFKYKKTTLDHTTDETIVIDAEKWKKRQRAIESLKNSCPDVTTVIPPSASAASSASSSTSGTEPTQVISSSSRPRSHTVASGSAKPAAPKPILKPSSATTESEPTVALSRTSLRSSALKPRRGLLTKRLLTGSGPARRVLKNDEKKPEDGGNGFEGEEVQKHSDDEDDDHEISVNVSRGNISISADSERKSATVLPPKPQSLSTSTAKGNTKPVAALKMEDLMDEDEEIILRLQQKRGLTTPSRPSNGGSNTSIAKPAATTSSSTSRPPISGAMKSLNFGAQQPSATTTTTTTSSNINSTAKPPPSSSAAPMNIISTQISAPKPSSTTSGGLGSQHTVVVNGVSYVKLEVIGRGGSSKVYKVMGPRRKIYALKKVALRGVDREAMEGFVNEIALVQSLKGEETIIQMIDAEIRENDVLYLVMEYGEIDLNKMLSRQQQRIDENHLRLYWQQMLEAVHTIHESRIVHGDLKPANFLFVEGRLKLIDFGIAKAISSDDTTHIAREQQVGTLNYMPPEAIVANNNGIGMGRERERDTFKVGRNGDTWSLGCILYQMVYGRPPFAHMNMFQKLHAIPDEKHEIPFPNMQNEALKDTLRRCLTRNPAKRMSIPDLLEHPFLHPERATAAVQSGAAGTQGGSQLNRTQIAALIKQLAMVQQPLDETAAAKLTELMCTQLESGKDVDVTEILSGVGVASAETTTSTMATVSSMASANSSSGTSTPHSASNPPHRPANPSLSLSLSSHPPDALNRSGVAHPIPDLQKELRERRKHLQNVATSSSNRFSRDSISAAKNGGKEPLDLGQQLKRRLQSIRDGVTMTIPDEYDDDDDDDDEEWKD